MDPALKDKLLRPRWLRWFIRRVFATGDTIRRAVQKPIVDTFVPARGEWVIDVGAGRGLYTLETLVPRFHRVVSVEIRQDHLAYLADQKRRYRLSNLGLVRASAERLPFKDGVFETAVCTEVIEHLTDDRMGVTELARVLQPGGQLVLSVPVPPAPRHDGAHVREGYTCEQLRGLLGDHGLTVVEMDYCLLLISRGVLHLVAFCETRLGIPPPLVFLCYLERWVLRQNKARLRPYDIVVSALKQDEMKVKVEHRSLSSFHPQPQP